MTGCDASGSTDEWCDGKGGNFGTLSVGSEMSPRVVAWLMSQMKIHRHGHSHGWNGWGIGAVGSCRQADCST